MTKLLKALFAPRETLPPHVRVELDDAGHAVLCETSCTPRREPPFAGIASRPL